MRLVSTQENYPSIGSDKKIFLCLVSSRLELMTLTQRKIFLPVPIHGVETSLNLTINRRFSVNQGDNKAWHSTETSLISSTDSILKAIDQTKVLAVVHLDMILPAKLEDVGVSAALKVILVRDIKQYVLACVTAQRK